jgi:hypothetical protein
VAHVNAALTPRQRLRLARAVVEDGWTFSYAAAVFQVAYPTAKRWALPYQQAGPAGMVDRSSRPHHCPRRTPRPLVPRVVHLRWRQRLGPVEIGARLGMPASTVCAVLRRCRLHRLSHADRRTGERIQRYEHARPGLLLHVDVKKLGNIPDGGGWRYLGRQRGGKHRAATPGRPRSQHRNPLLGTGFLHTVLDDHSRVAYAVIHDETAATAIGVLRRAVAWFAARGVTIVRVLSDNGSAYRSHAWRDACLELGHHAQAHPALPAADQRQDRATLPPNHGRRLGVPADVPQRTRPPAGSARLATRVQPSPAPHRDRTPPTDHPVDQPVWSVHLAQRTGVAFGGAAETTLTGWPAARTIAKCATVREAPSNVGRCDPVALHTRV